MLTGVWRACESQAVPHTSCRIGLVVVLDDCWSARMEALEAIVSEFARAIVSSAVAVRGLEGLGEGRASAVTWAADFLVVSPICAGRLRVRVEGVSGITGHVYAQCAKSSLKREYLSV